MDTNRDLNYRLYIQREEAFKRTSFQSEFDRYRDIASGNTKKVMQNFEEIKKDYSKGKGVLSDDPTKNVRYHFIISTAITSRMCIEAGMNHNVAYTLSDIYIRRADKCNSGSDIVEMLGEMFLDYTQRMNEIKKNNAASIHVRHCIDYIYEHLQEKLTVRDTAEYLKISPTYLSRLFAKETGMGFRKFILNAKINTAQNMIADPSLSFLEISLSLGFSSQSAFITAFKNLTGKTPGEFRSGVHYLPQSLCTAAESM